MQQHVVSDAAGLCDHWGVDYPDNGDWFRCLNRSIYKSTECGASISVYGTIPVKDAGSHKNLVGFEVRRQRMVQYGELLPVLQAEYDKAPDEEKLDIALADQDFQMAGQEDRLIAWARTLVPDAFPDIVVDYVPVVFHNGHREQIPESFKLTGFTIQTIVEGCEATVDSDTFDAATTTPEQIDAWIEDMEAQADDLWNDANNDSEGEE